MDKIIECVMNISEGRNAGFLERLSRMIADIPGAFLLSCSSDSDHNRSVFTFAGGPEAVEAAAWEACRETIKTLDIRKHQGVHPRIGVVDVVPFVPLTNSTLEECSQAAHRLGGKLGSRLEIPVYMYGYSARSPERAELSFLRRGGLPGLEERMLSEPPDYGPSMAHPKAGASAVGARNVLIAYNIDLVSRDVAIAKRIARSIRESSGGMPGVKALGLSLESRGCVQVSMNLVNFRTTSPLQVFNRVLELAQEEGIEVLQSEIIGHLPRAALDEKVADHLKIIDFDPGFHYIEDRLENVKNDRK